MKFYIGSDSGSGIEANTKEEFLRYLDDEIQKAEENNQEYFTITIETEN